MELGTSLPWVEPTTAPMECLDRLRAGLVSRVLSTSAIFAVAFGLVFTRICGSVGTAVAFWGAMLLWNAWLAIFVVRKLEIYPSFPRRWNTSCPSG